jgi:hypothetical protein
MARVQLINRKWIKITGIKTAIGDYNNWINRDWRRVAKIMLDKSTGEIWCDCFSDRNTWKLYLDKDIVSLSGYIFNYGTGEKLTMQRLKEYAVALLSE